MIEFIPRLTIIRGLPGSGKSTLAKQISAYTDDIHHFEADMYFINPITGEYEWDRSKLSLAHQWCQDQTYISLKQNFDVVVSNVFATTNEMKPYFDIAKQFGTIPQVILCQGNWTSIHDVPNETILRMKNRFQFNIESLYD